MKEKKICSSGSIKGLTQLINTFFFSTTYFIKENKVYNSKGLYQPGEIKKTKKRGLSTYTFYINN